MSINIIIFGSNSELAKGIIQKLIGKYNLVLVSRNHKSQIENKNSENNSITNIKVNSYLLKDLEKIKHKFKTKRKFKKIIILNFVGGFNQVKKFNLNKLSMWNEDFNLNFYTSINIIKFINNYFNKSYLYINISGGGTEIPLNGLSAYGISKLAINKLIEYQSVEDKNNYYCSIMPSYYKSSLFTQLKRKKIISIENYQKIDFDKNLSDLFNLITLIISKEEFDSINGKTFSSKYDFQKIFKNKLKNKFTYLIKK